MGLTISFANGKSFSDSYTADTSTQRRVLMTRDARFTMEYDFKGKFIAGDTFYIIPTKKVKRSLAVELYTFNITTINLFQDCMMDASKATITMSDGSEYFYITDGSSTSGTSFQAYLQKMNPTLKGKMYKVELTFQTGRNVT